MEINISDDSLDSIPPVSPVDMHQNSQEEEHSPNESLPDIIYPLPPKRARLTNQKQQPASHKMLVYFCTLYNFSTKYKSI